MRLLPEKSTLVVVGAFNPAILNPGWIAKNAMGLAEDRPVQVEMLTPVNLVVSAPPTRYVFDGISYSVTSQRLAFHFEGLDEAGAVKVVRVVRRIFELLTHTPVNGIGFNFGFSADRPSEKLRALLATDVSLLDFFGENASIAIQKWANTIQAGDELISVACAFDSESLSVDVNAHRNLSDAAGLIAALADDQVFSSHLAKAKALAVSLNEGDLE